MNDYLEWLTAGLIFLWILGAHDARAAPVDPGNVRCESPLNLHVRPHCPSPTRMLAPDSSAVSLPGRHHQPTANRRLLHRN